MTSICVACFSTASDDVAQWDRYAGKGTGVCLGFDTEKLESWWIRPSDEFGYPLNRFAGLVSYDKNEMSNLIKKSHEYPWDIAALYKNASYQSEQEYRLGCAGIAYWRYEFMPQKKNLKCYVTSKLPDFWSALKEVWIGSDTSPEAFYGWEIFLEKKCNGAAHGKVDLRRSETRLRS